MPNHPRVWSLFDIMNKFDVAAFAFIMHEVSVVKLGFTLLETIGSGGANKPSGRAHETMKRALSLAPGVFPSDMQDCLSAVRAAKTDYENELINVSRAAQIATRLEYDFVEGTKERQFLWIANDRHNLIDRDDLFGAQVYSQFPSARTDITQAGNCLAAECPTASVFHLMRACEVALRALARDRELSFSDKPLDLKEWGEILPKLASIVEDMRGDKTANWSDPQFKETQVRFYNEVTQELRTFNEAWRRHLSHARDDAFYDRGYANSVMQHVEKLMQKLALKISENTVTPKYWTDHEAKS